MKQNIIILSFILIFVSCEVKQRAANESIPFYNYSKPETFIINSDYQFLTDEQFNRMILNASKMSRFEKNVNIQINRAINRLGYELSVRSKDEAGKDRFSRTVDTTKIYQYFCVGKLNLHTCVNSLIILDYCGRDDFFDNMLWLINMKDNHICSIVLLGFFNNISGSPCPSVCIKNKIFKRTGIETGYHFFEYFGDRFPKKDKEIFTTFTIDENGFLQFTKD